MAVSYIGSTNPRDAAKNQRDLVQSKGDQLLQQQQDEIGGNEALRNDYRATLDRLYNPMAEGQGGYTPEEIEQIRAQGGMPSALTDAQANGNFLTPEEQAGIKGDTGSYLRNFNPDQMSQDQTVSAGRQRQAAADLQSSLKGAVNNDALSQSGKFQQDSENQLGNNQGQFGTVLGAVGNNVRGAIDPSAVTVSDSFLQDYNMSPEEEQRIVTGAGISAGAKDAAAVDAAERSARAAGSSPEGVMAYRARMARAQAGDAGDAMTQARIKASEAAAARKLTGEQLREQGGQYLTNVKTGTEMGLGQEALTGEQQLGQQALDQRNSVEQQRLTAEQAKTAANLNAATTGGQANLANEANINTQGRQQEQFNTTTGTGIAEAQDTANSARAGAVAGNRQTTGVNNQGTQFNQGKTLNDTASTRATGVANTRLGAQTQGLNYYQGQNTQANQNAENNQNREVSTYGTQAGAGNAATSNAVGASQTPTTLDKVLGGVAGGLGAAASFLDDGGVATDPTLAVVGEHGPEWIGPAQNGMKAAAGFLGGMSGKKPNPWQQFGDRAAKFGGTYRAHRQDQADPSKTNPGAYGPANPAGSMTNFPQPDEEADSPDATPMADGQVVTKPTLALVGENEPEMVVPLGYRARAKTRPSMAFGNETASKRRPFYGEAA